MNSAADITNVVEAANLDGRQERLEGMLVQLECCEKALQVGRWRLAFWYHFENTRNPEIVQLS
jgi:hypothetical protein